MNGKVKEKYIRSGEIEEEELQIVSSIGKATFRRISITPWGNTTIEVEVKSWKNWSLTSSKLQSTNT